MGKIVKLLVKQDPDTSKNTLLKLKYALDSAKSIIQPNRYMLIELYNDIKSESHLKSCVRKRKSRTKKLEFTTENETIDEMFQTKWFRKYLEYTLDTLFFGNSVIEIFFGFFFDRRNVGDMT